MMAEIEGLARALREGVDAAYTAASWALGSFACIDVANAVWIAGAGHEGIPRHVDLLRDGSAYAKLLAARTLGHLACRDYDNQRRIVAAGGIPPLVDLLRDGSAEAKLSAASTLSILAYSNIANQNLIAKAGGVPPLVELLRDGSAHAKRSAASALHYLAYNNDANAVAIAAAVSLEALVQLARRGRATVDSQSLRVGVPGKRKAALVVAALLRACVPVEVRGQADVRDVIRDVIGPYL